VTPPEVTVMVDGPATVIRLAGTEAVNCAALTYVVDSAWAFQYTTAPEANPLPFTVSVNAGPPATTGNGLSEEIAGPWAMVKFTLPELTPPETTVMGTVPCDAIRLADTDAVSCAALTYVVDSDVPFHFTTAPEANPLPFTVSVKADAPAVALDGLSEVMTGPALTVIGNPVAAEVYPPEIAKTENDPALAIRLAGTEAVTCVALTYVVASVVELLGVVYQSTEAPDENPVPFTVSVNAGPPAVTLDGFNEVIEGMTGSWEPPDVTPPEVTVMVAAPATVIKLAGTVAVNCVALTYVVVNAVPFQFTNAPEANPLPFTVSVKFGPPATTGVGLSEVIAGPALMLNCVKAELPPPESTNT
jgi:hypothetical protein